MNEFVEKWREGLVELLYHNAVWGSLARAIGQPVASYELETAWVQYEPDQKTIVFAFNPDFMESLEPDMVAGVLLHETHHVFRGDLDDLQDKLNYPNNSALVKAHECTINDVVEGVFGIELPGFVMRGQDLAQTDMSSMTVFEAYRIFDQQEDEESNSSESGDGDRESEEESSGSSPSSGKESEEGDSDSTEKGQQTSDSSGSNSGACGGIIIPEGHEEEAAQSIKDIFGSVAAEKSMTPEELEELLNDSNSGGFSPTGMGVEDTVPLSDARMNWFDLLAEINPKINTAGAPRRKTKNNWTTYNRRLGSVYPRVILPKVEAVKPKAGEDGDSLPTFVIALDLSGSIDRKLVGTLKSLLQDIPEELIRAFPVTWSTSLVEFNEDNNWRTVSRGGTSIYTVVDYVKKVKARTGTDPYVLVITDGDFHSRYERPGKDWFWMAVDNPSKTRIRNRGHSQAGETVYYVGDFKV